MPPAAPTFAVSYKKQDGSLSIDHGKELVIWTATAAGPIVTVPFGDILLLQQTPASSARVSVKLVVQPAGQTSPENYIFVFPPSPDARTNQATVKDAILKAIELKKAQPGSSGPASSTTTSGPGSATAAQSTPASSDGPIQKGVSASMSFANTVSAASTKPDPLYDDAKLIANAELQSSLVESNPTLKKRFSEALAEKPDSISPYQLAAQFWSTRTGLLRAHALEKKQSQGSYNALAEVKAKSVDGRAILSLSKERIQLIFSQYPVVRTIYNELVPRLSESEFWSKFYQSRVFKRLRGERITDEDLFEKDVDKCLHFLNQDDHPFPFDQARFPLFIDIEGNEQDNSERLGNRPDFTMRPSSHEKVPLLRVLNRMSEKMIHNVANSDGNLFAPAGLTELAWQSFQLHDLADRPEDSRQQLNVQDPDHLAGPSSLATQSSEVAMYSKMAPHKVVSLVKNDVDSRLPRSGSIDLEAALDLRSNRDRSASPPAGGELGRAGSRAGRATTSRLLMADIRQKAKQLDNPLSKRTTTAIPTLSSLPMSETKLPAELLDSLSMTFHTTVEFLRYFWTVFYSGDPNRAGEMQALVHSLEKSLERIKSVAETAKRKRKQQLTDLKKREDELFKQTGRRRRGIDASVLIAGEAQVYKMLEPTIRAIKRAMAEYKSACEAQVGESAKVKS